MPDNVTGWLQNRYGAGQSVPINTFITSQQAIQKHFAARLPNIANAVTRRVVKKGIWRVGKLQWDQSEPISDNAARFAAWTKTKRTTAAEQNLAMNCWEGVLYLAFQADAITRAKCMSFYRKNEASDSKIRRLFGTAAVYSPPLATPNMGDLLGFEENSSNVVNHVAIYLGLYNNQHYMLHNLSYDGTTTQLHAGSGFHFEAVSVRQMRYGVAGGTLYFTTPFWVANSPTHAYAAAL